MDSRERVARALAHEEPDRVPVDLWLSSRFKEKLLASRGTSFGEFLDVYDVDLRYIEGPAYVGPPLRLSRAGDADIWGVQRRTVTVPTEGGMETYKEVALSPLAGAATADEVHDYAGWPSADWFDFSGIEAQCEAVHAQGRAAVFMGDRMNRVAQLKPAMYVRGMQTIYMDMATNPELAHAVFAIFGASTGSTRSAFSRRRGQTRSVADGG